MLKHTEIGRNGEQIAVNFLKNKGYEVLAQNWRYSRKEIDIISRYNDCLIFVEVKTRSSFDFGFPEESVTEQKKSFLKMAAEAYCDTKATSSLIRFDIISIYLAAGQAPAIHHIEDAFF